MDSKDVVSQRDTGSSDENTGKEIVAHLLEQYNPLAIYLSGSRANGRNRSDSDWDFHLVVADGVHPLSGVLHGFSIDIKYLVASRVGDSIIDTPYSPAVPFQCLYRDERHESALLDLERRTGAAYEAGPEAWTAEDRTENRLRALRFM